MSLVINTNVSSLDAQRQLTGSGNALSTSLQRLSSGLRINSAKDDAAGLAIAQRFTAQINGLDQAARNANDGISLAQTAEGGLSTSGDILQRMRQLAVQSANGTNSSSDRASLQLEVSQLQQELNRIAGTTQFNGMNVLDGSMSATQFQVGANANQTISFGISSAKASDLGNYTLATATGAGIAVATTAAASTTPVSNSNVAQTLTLAGNGKSTSVAVTAGESAYAVANAVNAASSTTGVSANAITTATLSGLSSTGTVSFNLNGKAVSATVSATNDLTSLSTAINAQSASTGVTATVNGGTITLTEATGKDIAIDSFTNSSGGTINLQGEDAFNNNATTGAAATLTSGGTNSSTVGGEIQFGSSNGYTISTTDTTGTLFASTAQQASTLSAISSLDITTVQGANNALSTIDAALTAINNSRAALGAIQNRFTNTISSLNTTSENLSAARSRIQDTDFATETANMTRNQILQQAGTAMLAQANSLPNNVLTLLKG
jgi:flagellin